MNDISFREFAELPLKRQEEIIRIWSESADSMEKLFSYGHSDKLHVDMTDEQLIHRAMRDMCSSSAFTSKNGALDAAKELIYFHAKDIALWLTDPMRRKEKKLVFTEELYGEDDKKIGYGINENMRKRETDIVTIVIERNFDKYSMDAFFFYVKTIFPNIDRVDPSRETLPLSLDEIRKMQSKILKEDAQMGTIAKCFWISKMLGYKPQIEETEKGLYFYIKFRLGDNKYSLMVNSNSFNYFHPHLSIKTESGWKKLNTQEEMETHSKAVNIANDLMSIYHKINIGLIEEVLNDIQSGKITPRKEWKITDNSIPVKTSGKNIEEDKNTIDAR